MSGIGDYFGQGFAQGTDTALKYLLKAKMQGLADKARDDKKRDELKDPVRIRETNAKFLKLKKAHEAADEATLDEFANLTSAYLEQGYSEGHANEKAYQDLIKAGEIKEDESSEKKRNFLEKGGQKAVNFLNQKGQEFFDYQQTPRSLEARKRAQEKAGNFDAPESFSKGEIFQLTPEDIQNYSKEDQKKIKKLQNEARAHYPSHLLPLIGEGAEERFREIIDEDLPLPPRISSLVRTGLEIYLLKGLGAGSLATQGLKGAAVFGGGAAFNEAIRTMGTDKPADLNHVAMNGIMGLMFPVAEKGMQAFADKIWRPLRNRIASIMKASRGTAGEAAEAVINGAERQGININKVQQGDPSEMGKFNDFIQPTPKPSVETPSTPRPSAETPSTPKAPTQSLKGRVTNVGGKGINVPAPEKVSRAHMRYQSNVKSVKDVPTEKYLQEKPDKLRKADRPAVQKQLSETRNEISATEKQLFNSKGSELKTAQEKLLTLRQKESNLQHLLKQGKPRLTASELRDEAVESAKGVVNKIIKNDPESKKAIAKNNKRIQTWLDRFKAEIGRKKIPAQINRDQFIAVQEAHIEAYEDMLDLVKKEVKDPKSHLYNLPQEEELVQEFTKRLSSLKKEIATQSQKNLAKKLTEGGMGKFYRAWIGKVKNDQNILTKDMIRLNNRIKESEQQISKVARNAMNKAEVAAKNNNLVGVYQQAGATPQEAKELNKSFNEAKESVKDLVSNAGQRFEASANQARGNQARGNASANQASANQATRNATTATQQKNIQARLTAVARTKIRSFLDKSLINQAIVGATLGSLDSLSQEIRGKKIPGQLKLGVLGLVGLSGKKGVRYPVLAISAYFTDKLLKNKRIESAKQTLASKKGLAARKEYYSNLKKRGFNTKELKEIRGETE